MPCFTMNKTLKCINKNHKFIKRPVLTNSCKFVVHKNVTLWYMYLYVLCLVIKSAGIAMT